MRKMYRSIRLLLVCALWVAWVENTYAQGLRITGKVVDSNTGETLPGVNVVIKGTNVGVATDAAGTFNLEAPSDATLIVSAIGYANQEVSVGGRTTIDVSLVGDSQTLNDIIVVGYGTQDRKTLAGSVAKITSERIEGRPITSAEQALSGLTPGINVAQPGASPGDLATINIRGIGSISAGYSPLFVIDGYPTDQRNFAAINPRDIASIEVLKDASATAIYGSRGANGVIMVTTKAAKEGKPQINVGLSTGLSQIPDSARPKLLSGQEYVDYYTESFTNRGQTVPASIANWNGTETNWQDVVYETGAFHDLNISASGGSAKTSYLISGNYIEQQGTVIGEGQRKYSVRLSVDHRPNDRISFGLMAAPNFTDIWRGSPAPEDGTDWASANSLAYLLPPILPVRRADGTYALPSDLNIPGPVGLMANPLELLDTYTRKTLLFRIIANSYVSAEIAKGLTFRTSIGVNFSSDKTQTLYNAPGPRFTLPSVSQLTLGHAQGVNWLSETTLAYKKAINNHSFDALLGYAAQEDNLESLNANVSSLTVTGPTLLSLGDTRTLTAANGVTSNTLLSYLGRLNYSYSGKYLLTASIRRDGSSRFGANNRFKTFWAIAAGWNFSEEGFIRNLDFISSAKLRGSYGTTGSNGIPNFVARPSLTPVNATFGSSQLKGVYNNDPGNANLTWETSKKLDIGLDLSVLRNRVTLVFDYYNNKTEDLLLAKSLPLSSGYAGTLTNIGSMKNYGWELTLSGVAVKTNDLSVTIGGNVTHNSQEVLSLGGANELFNFFGALRTVVGKELQQIRGVEAIGVVRQGDVLPAQSTAKPGDIKFKDVDGNNAISDFLGGDGQLVGEPNIDWLYGINASIKYKNFELFTLLQGQAGGSVYDFYLIQVGTDAQGVNLSRDFWYSGRYIDEQNPGDGKTPRAGALLVSGGAAGVGFVSSLGVQKTDYMRIRNMTLTYSIPSAVSSKIRVNNARAFISVENLHTFTKFIGGNPDARRNSIGGPGLLGGSRLAGTYDGRELALTSVPSLPLPRTWTLGVTFSF
jgi:TonB-dependent starch-binding outer membrane protein SusC